VEIKHVIKFGGNMREIYLVANGKNDDEKKTKFDKGNYNLGEGYMHRYSEIGRPT